MPSSKTGSVAAALREARILRAAKQPQQSAFSPPRIEVRNHQRAVAVSVPKLEQFASTACALVWKRRRQASDIAFLHHIDVLIVSDARMAVLHKKFSGIPGPTDVLTFHHGEIAISADTAARQARSLSTSAIAEMQLYILHGLLHLAGFDDTTASKGREMHRLQNKLMILITGCQVR